MMEWLMSYALSALGTRRVACASCPERKEGPHGRRQEEIEEEGAEEDGCQEEALPKDQGGLSEDELSQVAGGTGIIRKLPGISVN